MYSQALAPGIWCRSHSVCANLQSPLLFAQQHACNCSDIRNGCRSWSSSALLATALIFGMAAGPGHLQHCVGGAVPGAAQNAHGLIAAVAACAGGRMVCFLRARLHCAGAWQRRRILACKCLSLHHSSASDLDCQYQPYARNRTGS